MADPEKEIDLIALFSLFLRNKFKIIVLTCLGATVGVCLAFLATPIYRADALIQLEEKSSGGMALSSDLSGLFSSTPLSVAEIEILRSRMVLGEVIEKLDLSVQAEPLRLPVVGNLLSRIPVPQPEIEAISAYAWHGEAIRVGHFTVPQSMLDQPFKLTYLGASRYSVEGPGGAELEGEVGVLLRAPGSGIELRVDSIIGAPGKAFILKYQNFADTLRDLRANYSISERGKNSSILQLSMQHADPELARQILGTITDIYLLQNVARNAAEAEKSLSFIEEQLPLAEANMREAESRVNEYKLSQDSVDLTFETRSLLEQSVTIEAQLNQLLLEEQELQKKYTQAHPVYQTLLDSRAQLESQLTELRGQSVNLPETQLEMLRLSQNLEVAQAIYLQMVNRAQELSVIKAGTIGNIRIIDSPMAFPRPVKPSKPVIVAVSTMIGFLLALAWVFVQSLRNRGVERQDELEQLGLSVFGVIQKVGNGDHSSGFKRGEDIPVLAKSAPTNLAVEAMRSLRTSLHFGMLDSASNILLLTSSRPGEGKSFLAVNLASVMAQSGQKVCLVDTDLRRGYLRRYFGLAKSEPGLSDVLSGKATLEDAIKVDSDTGLHFLPSGFYPPNPSELLMHKNFEQFCATLNSRFDMVIMDAPPLLAVTDPVIIGKYAGMTLLVVRHLFTQIGEVGASLKSLENNGLKATGAILNNYAPKENKSRAGDYSYQYEYKSRS